MSDRARKIKVALPLIIFLVIAFFLWKGLDRNPHRLPSPFIGKALPGFQAQSLLHQNKTISSELLEGHVSLLNVFASWCVSCQAEHPTLMDIYNSHDVKIYGLNYKDKRANAEGYLKKYGDPYTKVFFDPAGTIAINLGVYGTPETFILNKRGIVVDKIIGPISPDQWRDTLQPDIKRLEAGRPWKK